MPANFNNAPFNGAPTPTWATGVQRSPNWVVDDSATLTTTATRLYYYPMYFDRAETLTGARTCNAGAGDNGETYRVGLYFDNGASGGPGTLAVDFGTVTLTAASAVRTLASSYAMTSPGWYWIAVHHNTACSMYCYRVGNSADVNLSRGIGSITSSASVEWDGSALQPFFYVDTAYGALASTAVAPTASTNQAPSVRFYK
jgi:hypothetical protein